MLLIVQETHPTLLQAMTVKNVAINQDSSVKYTRMGVRLVEKLCTSPIMLKLVHEKVFTCERGGGLLSCIHRDNLNYKFQYLVLNQQKIQ